MNRAAYVPAPPVAPETCPGCRAFAPECKVPAEAVGRSGAPIGMCWLCAHVVCDHGHGDLDTAWEHVGECDCEPEAVYPAELAARKRLSSAESALEVVIHAELVQKLEAPAPRSKAMNARERSAKARAAASRTAIARRENALARRGAEVHADRLEALRLPESERDRVDRVVTVGD